MRSQGDREPGLANGQSPSKANGVVQDSHNSDRRSAAVHYTSTGSCCRPFLLVGDTMRPGRRMALPDRLLLATCTTTSARQQLPYRLSQSIGFAGRAGFFSPCSLLTALRRNTLAREMSSNGGNTSPVSSLRTGTTSALWQRRRELEMYKANATKAQDVFVEKVPSDSRITHNLPIASDPVLRGQYLNFRNGIR